VGTRRTKTLNSKRATQLWSPRDAEVRIQMLKLGIVILATWFSVAGVRAQQQAPEQSNQDQQKNQDQQQNQGQQQNQNPSTPNSQNPEQNQSQPQQPIPAYRSPLGGMAGGEEDNAAPPQYEPDTRPLAGAEDLSVGVPAERRSNWAPYVSVLATGDSSPLGGTAAGWTSYESVVGGLNLEKVSRLSDLNLQYLGGGTFSNNSSVGTSIVQNLGITDTLHWQRNSLLIADQFGYFPEASFGYGGVVGLPGLSTTVGGLQSVFVPGESVLTAEGQRVTNSFVAQLNTALSARSSVTLVGGYSLLRFLDNSLLDYGDITAQAGYNYQMTRRDTVAVIYHFDQLRYSSVTPMIENHTVEVSYAHQVTGKLAFQAAAGPEISFYPNSLMVGGTSANSTSHVSWSMNTGLTYQQKERTTLGLQYSHGVTGGSGVFLGAQSDQVSGSLNYRMSGVSSLGLTSGYARNRGLSAAGVTSSSQVYDYWFGGATFDRSLNRTWNLSLSYELQYQESNLGFCITPQCGTSFTRNVVSLGVNWDARPIPF
jgi:hypothetical protein